MELYWRIYFIYLFYIFIYSSSYLTTAIYWSQYQWSIFITENHIDSTVNNTNNNNNQSYQSIFNHLLITAACSVLLLLDNIILAIISMASATKQIYLHILRTHTHTTELDPLMLDWFSSSEQRLCLHFDAVHHFVFLMLNPTQKHKPQLTTNT